jgi:hypothetical protein
LQPEAFLTAELGEAGRYYDRALGSASAQFSDQLGNNLRRRADHREIR